MPDLKTLQRKMTQAFLSGNSDIIEELVIPGGELSVQEAIEVYHNGSVARLIDTLSETFEAVWWVLGDQGFIALCREFISLNPSTFTDLSDYHPGFGSFLESKKVATALPFLPDLAVFEWEFKELFHQPQVDGLGPKEFSAIPGLASKSFSFGPHVIFESSYAIYDLWKQRKTAEDKAFEINWQHSQKLLLYKKSNNVFIREISDLEMRILKELSGSKNIIETIAALEGQGLDPNPEEIQNLFTFLASSRLLVEKDSLPGAC